MNHLVLAAVTRRKRVPLVWTLLPHGGGSSTADRIALMRRYLAHFPVASNPPAHKVGGVREMIEAAGARVLYLRPCSPGFNPIEQAFAKLKAFLRKVAARTLDALEAAIDAFARDECANYFTASGYEPD